MTELQNGLKRKPPEERLALLIQAKYTRSLDSTQLATVEPIGSGLMTDTYVIASQPHVLKVLRDPLRVHGELLELEYFEQNALALEKLAPRDSDIARWPSLITRGTYQGKPAQVETNLVYHPSSIVGIQLADYLKTLTMDKRLKFYNSILAYLWLQDSHGVVTYDVKTGNWGIYGQAKDISKQVHDPNTATLLDFGVSWVEGSPYNTVTRQKAYDEGRAYFLLEVGSLERAASTYWQSQETQWANGNILDFEVQKRKYYIAQEKLFQQKHLGKLETMARWKDEQMDITQLMYKFRDLFIQS